MQYRAAPTAVLVLIVVALAAACGPPPPPTTTPTVTTTTTVPPSASTSCGSDGGVAAGAVDHGSMSGWDEPVPASRVDEVVAEAGDRDVAVTYTDTDGAPTTASVAATDVDDVVDFLEVAGSDLTAVDVVRAAEVADAEAAAWPDDPYLSNQWAFDDASYIDAWAFGTGAGVTVAVLDTGVVTTHPDLGDRVVPGVDYTAGAALPAPYSGGDVYGHGTKVAGVIGATADNGIGIAGVAPDATILAVKVLGDNGTGTSIAVANGIVWAADNGAQVINLSMVIESPSEPLNVTNAVAYARAKGVVVIAAVGNDGRYTTDIWPAACPQVVAVGSYRQGRQLSTFSNSGPFVDLVAPGENVMTTTNGLGYGPVSGTSFATPHVAGVAALMLSAGMDRALVPDRLRLTADDAGPIGYDTGFGYGVLDPLMAVS